MQKIISLFKPHPPPLRTPLARHGAGPRLVYDELVPGAEWVADGAGIATRKWDGTCVLIENGHMWKRYDVKNGKTPPPGFLPAQPAPDPVTGHWPGWLAVNAADPSDRWHIEALWNDDAEPADYPDGTYELVGPKVNGNPEGFQRHTLLRHGHVYLPTAPRTFDALRGYFQDRSAAGVDIEGIVWHHPDGRMVKIKASDLGLKRSAASTATP